MKFFPGHVLIAAVLSATATVAMAQESTNQVPAKTDWSVFTDPPEGKPTVCWGVSSPKETINTKDGAPASVRRSDILLFVSFNIEGPGTRQISFTSGYPFADKSTVKVQVADSTFEMMTKGEYAYTLDNASDDALLAALKGGDIAILTAASGKGTKTQDTFSLRGFTAAMAEAETRCK